MRALPDINVLIALLDPQHVFHNRSHRAWGNLRKGGFATCPLTENGVIRILSNPGYPGSEEFGIVDVIERLRGLTHNSDHEFWADDVSLLDQGVFDHETIVGPKQITDIYLLGLATQRNGMLVTFDRHIASSTVKLGKAENLRII